MDRQMKKEMKIVDREEKEKRKRKEICIAKKNRKGNEKLRVCSKNS